MKEIGEYLINIGFELIIEDAITKLGSIENEEYEIVVEDKKYKFILYFTGDLRIFIYENSQLKYKSKLFELVSLNDIKEILNSNIKLSELNMY